MIYVHCTVVLTQRGTIIYTVNVLADRFIVQKIGHEEKTLALQKYAKWLTG